MGFLRRWNVTHGWVCGVVSVLTECVSVGVRTRVSLPSFGACGRLKIVS